MFCFWQVSTLTFVALVPLGCTMAGPINQINLRDWINVERWMKVEGTKATRENEDEMGGENDRQLSGTVARCRRRRETEKEKNKIR